jgi:hypothetical protein
LTLNLLLTQEPADKTVVFADPVSGGKPRRARKGGTAMTESVIAGLSQGLSVANRLVFPLPDQISRRYTLPPALMRARHADLWHALSSDERKRVALAAGPTAAFLSPAIGRRATTIVAVGNPTASRMAEGGAWRMVLGPFPELDDVPDDADAEWRERVLDATSAFKLIRRTEIAGIATEVATLLGLGPKAAFRAGETASSVATLIDRPAKRDNPAHWLDELLLESARERAALGELRVD